MKNLLLLLLLAGCAADDGKWYRSGASDQAFEMDKGQCQAQAFGVPGANVMQVALVFNSCMRGKGWQLVSS